MSKSNFKWKSPLLLTIILHSPIAAADDDKAIAASAEAPTVTENNTKPGENQIESSLKSIMYPQDEETIATSTTFVLVPEAGWYGLCFATNPDSHANNSDRDNDDDNDDQKTASSNGDDEERNRRRDEKSKIEFSTTAPPKKKPNSKVRPTGFAATAATAKDAQQFQLDYDFYVTMQFNNDDKKTKIVTTSTAKSEEPPLKTAVTVQKIQPLQEIRTKEIAVDIGRLHYFPEGCSIGLVQQAKDPSNKGARQSWKWFLTYNSRVSKDVHAGSVGVTAESSRKPSTTDAIITTTCPPAVVPGMIPLVKKSIVCAHCPKRFPIPKAAIDHRNQAHNKTITRESGTQPRSAGKTELLPDKLDILYQDNYMAVIDKPQGVAVMGTSISLFRSGLLISLAVPEKDREYHQLGVSQATVGDCSNTGQGVPVLKYKYKTKPVPVHRLDGATGGILVIAKTNEAESHLKESFRERKCQKCYRALLLGRLEPLEGLIEDPISNKPSSTRYVVTKHHPCVYSKDGWVTAIDLFPHTGRKHQLRRHTKSLGHSIWGDRRHGGMIYSTASYAQNDAGVMVKTDEGDAKLKQMMSRMCLWAVELTIPHPVSNENLTFQLKDPEWLEHVIQGVAPVTSTSG